MRILCVAALTILSGCATLTNRFGTATMEADPTEIGAESIALQNELSLAYTRTPPTFADPQVDLCRFTQPSFQEQNKHAYSRHYDNPNDTGAEKFKCLYLRQPDPNSLQVQRHVLAGFLLSDLYCDQFFRRIARRWNERLFVRNTTNDVGAAISAVLGLAKAGSGVTGGVGAGFGLADSAFRNYDNVFVVSPDLPAMQKLVREHQLKFRDETLAAVPTDYYSAQTKIIQYAQLCSYTGMKGLLNAAVDTTINDLRGEDGISKAVLKAATSGEAQARAIAEKKAADAEAALDAVKRERAAKEALKKEQAPATQDTSTPSDSSARVGA